MGFNFVVQVPEHEAEANALLCSCGVLNKF